MKLVNKKTGEVATLTLSSNGEDLLLMKNDEMVTRGVKLSDLEEWEDYEQPKEHYFITEYGEVFSLNEYEGLNNVANPEDYKQIGNYFNTREEAEKAVEKLKAWKRLKEAGFNFGSWSHTPITKSLTGYNLHIKAYSDKLADYMDDLHLLFGGEE